MLIATDAYITNYATGCSSAWIECRFWEAEVADSNSVTPIGRKLPPLNTSTIRMEVYTVEEFQERWDEMITRVENGEHIGIVNADGTAAVMVSAEDELIKIHTELNNEAP